MLVGSREWLRSFREVVDYKKPALFQDAVALADYLEPVGWVGQIESEPINHEIECVAVGRECFRRGLKRRNSAARSFYASLHSGLYPENDAAVLVAQLRQPPA